MNLHKIIVLFALGILSALPVSAQVQEGDTLNFWSVSYIDWPPLWGSPQRQFKAVCKKSGTHCRVFVETTATMPDQSKIDQLVATFDSAFYPSLVQKYGPVPDQMDNDPAVYIVALNEQDWAGYFDPGQQMPDTTVLQIWGRRSCQHEVIYVAADYFDGAQEISAHEFGHLIHWGRDHSPEPSEPGIFWETAFVDEGFSTFAAEYLTGNLFQHNVFDGDAFFRSDPDIPLIYFSNYDQAKLFMTFMFEHYGQWDYISALINNQLNGWQGVDSTLRLLGYSTDFPEVFEQFCLANYLDDSTFMGGKYSYAHFRFPGCVETVYDNTFSSSPVSGTLSSFGSDYIGFMTDAPQPVQLVFQGDSLRKYRVAFLEMENTDQVRKVVSRSPDASGRVIYVADSLGLAFNKLVMVAMCTDPNLDTTGVAPYSYYVLPLASVPGTSLENGLKVLPNPAKDKLFVELPAGIVSGTPLEILDTNGILKASYPVGENSVSIDISQLPAGSYVIRIRLKDRLYSTRFVHTR